MTAPIVPKSFIALMEAELKSIQFGGCSLIANVRDGKITYRLEKVISVMAGGS